MSILKTTDDRSAPPNDKKPGIMSSMLNEHVPVVIFLPILLVVILCACFCCFIYLKRVNSKLSTVSTMSGEDSSESSKEEAPTTQKLASPRSHTTTLGKATKNTTEAVSLSSTMYGADGLIIPQDKDKKQRKAYMQHSPSSTILIQHTSPKAYKSDDNRRRSSNRLDVAKSIKNSPSSTIFIRHTSPKAFKSDNSRRRSSNRLEVHHSKSIKNTYDSPQFTMATIPSKNTMDGSLLGGKRSSVDDEHSMLAMDGSYYVKAYAEEGQELQGGEISRVITMEEDDDYVIDVINEDNDDEKQVTNSPDICTAGGDTETLIDLPKMRLESDEFIVRSDSVMAQETKR